MSMPVCTSGQMSEFSLIGDHFAKNVIRDQISTSFEHLVKTPETPLVDQVPGRVYDWKYDVIGTMIIRKGQLLT